MLSQRTTTFFMIVLSICANRAFANELVIDSLKNIAISKDVVLIGEDHNNPLNAKIFYDLLKAIEKGKPDRLGLIALEIYSDYQKDINRYLETGDITILESTPDKEALRGHKKSDEIINSFRNIFQTIFEINSHRKKSERLNVVAMDKKPDSQMTLLQWAKKHCPAGINSCREFQEWVWSRDPLMMNNIKGPIEKEISKKRLSLIYIGSAHIKKRGIIRIKTLEGSEIEIKHLGARLFEAFPRTISINQNDPMNDCEDLIETTAKKSGLNQIILFNLSTHPYGNLENIHCPAEYPSPYTYVPYPFKARDHFDYYLYYPSSRI